MRKSLVVIDVVWIVKINVKIHAVVCRGDRKIAKLKMERDIAEVMYESCMQAIYATKLEMNIVNDMMAAERKGE